MLIFIHCVLFSAASEQQQDPFSLLREAKMSLGAKEYAIALEKLQILVAQFPGSAYAPESLYYIGKCYYRLKQYSSAVTTLNNLIQMYPQDPWAKNGYRLLWYCFSALSRDTEAIATFEKFISENPTSSYCADAALRIARLISRDTTASTTEKLKAFKRVVDCYPNTPEAKEAQLSYGNLLWRLSEEIRRGEINRGEISRRYVDEALAMKDTTIVYFRDLIHQYANDTELAAYAQMQIGALWIEKARLLDKEQYPETRKEYFALAKEKLESVLVQYPMARPEIIATVRLMLAEIALFTGDRGRALTELRELIAEFNTDSTCRRPICMAHYWVALITENDHKYAEAIHEYQKILDNYSVKDNYLWSNLQALALYGQYRCYSELGDNLAGIKVLLELINRFPNELITQFAKEELNKLGVSINSISEYREE